LPLSPDEHPSGCSAIPRRELPTNPTLLPRTSWPIAASPRPGTQGNSRRTGLVRTAPLPTVSDRKHSRSLGFVSQNRPSAPL